jgi:hypothetical protein
VPTIIADPSYGRARESVQAKYFAEPMQRIIQRLLEEDLSPADRGDADPLYQTAPAVEKDEELPADMAEWEIATIDDGLADASSRRNTGK